MQKLLTRLDLRRAFQISDRTLRRWIQLGVLPPPVFQGRWTLEQIQETLAKCGHLRTQEKN